ATKTSPIPSSLPSQIDRRLRHRYDYLRPVWWLATCGCGSMLGAIRRIVHSDANLDVRLRDRIRRRQGVEQGGCRFEGIRDLFAACGMARLRLVEEPHLHREAILLLADAGRQVRVARGT